MQLYWLFTVQQPRAGLWVPIILLSGLVIVAEVAVVISWFLFGDNGAILENEWFKLLGLARYVYHVSYKAYLLNVVLLSFQRFTVLT